MSRTTLFGLIALSLIAECGQSSNHSRHNGILYDGVNNLTRAEAPPRAPQHMALPRCPDEAQARSHPPPSEEPSCQAEDGSA